MLQTGLLATALTVSRYITKATQTNIQFLHAVGAVAHATPSRTHADYHNALISLSKWGPFHLFCHSCNVAISLIYPIYLAFQTLSCLAQQSARGWGPPRQLYLWPSLPCVQPPSTVGWGTARWRLNVLTQKPAGGDVVGRQPRLMFKDFEGT